MGGAADVVASAAPAPVSSAVEPAGAASVGAPAEAWMGGAADVVALAAPGEDEELAWSPIQREVVGEWVAVVLCGLWCTVAVCIICCFNFPTILRSGGFGLLVVCLSVLAS